MIMAMVIYQLFVDLGKSVAGEGKQSVLVRCGRLLRMAAGLQEAALDSALQKKE